MKNANQHLNRLRQPNVLPFSASWTCYLGNLGCYARLHRWRFSGLLVAFAGGRCRDAASGPADAPAAVVNRPSFDQEGSRHVTTRDQRPEIGEDIP